MSAARSRRSKATTSNGFVRSMTPSFFAPALQVVVELVAPALEQRARAPRDRAAGSSSSARRASCSTKSASDACSFVARRRAPAQRVDGERPEAGGNDAVAAERVDERDAVAAVVVRARGRRRR